MVENNVPMGGWKTKLGAALTGLGTALGGTVLTVAPEPAKKWVALGAAIVGAVGIFFTIWGVGHKITKAQEAVVKVQDPNHIQLTNAERKAILRLREKKQQG